MITLIPNILAADQLRAIHQQLKTAHWVDGRETVGPLGGRVKHNRQLAENCPIRDRLGRQIVAALRRQPLFHAIALPRRIFAPRFNRYACGEHYGDHIDGAILQTSNDPLDTEPMRSDLSCTVFLSAPESYDGGELIIDTETGPETVKGRAGAAVVYPADRVHRVAPVTRGERIAAFFWIESLVRDPAQRRILIELDATVQQLMRDPDHHDTALRLTGIYHNLLRQMSGS